MDGAQYGDPEGEMLQGYRWSETADKNGFAAISLVQSEASKMILPERYARMFPEHSTWRSQFGLVSPSDTVDDVRYFHDVLRGVRGAMNVGKINLVGFCDGGCLAHGLARTIPMNGIATVGSTIFKAEKAVPLPGARGFFATMKDDMVLQEGGGPGRSFGKLLAQAGHTRVLDSAPLEQGATYARANHLVSGMTTESSIGVEHDWINPNTMQPQVKELSLNEGGHNWPGTKFSTLSKAKSDSLAPDTSRAFNQKIVDFFESAATRLPGSRMQ
jgi:poly(3-hydroxybutyrate) depolymerase